MPWHSPDLPHRIEWLKVSNDRNGSKAVIEIIQKLLSYTSYFMFQYGS